MTTKNKTIIDLTHDEVFEFLMDKQQYCSIELPEYFDFQPVLDYCKDACKDHTVPAMPHEVDDVNLELLMNKDGHYGVRPLTIANPYLYTFLVQTICEEKAWAAIVDCFKAFHVDSIQACAIPVVPTKGVKESFFKSTTILDWWNKMEQQPIELSLKYRYMFMTDITNCYGQIMPRSIDWALARKDTDLSTDENHQLASTIMRLITAMQDGKIEGIPQGSVLFGFIAEIVLGYSDLLLDRAIKASGITADYQILRYVDDYRIFCNDRAALEKISYILQHTLEKLNFRMNVSKTKISDNIVTDAVKPDKAFYIFNTPIFNKKGVDFDGFQRHLYFIYEFGKRYPNCGQMKVLLSDFCGRIQKRLKEFEKNNNWEEIVFDDDVKDIKAPDQVNTCSADDETTEVEEVSIFSLLFTTQAINERILPMVAILVQIATGNISACHYALRIISLLLSTIENNDEKHGIIAMIYHRLRNLPNSTYLQLWLQNLTYITNDPAINDYDAPLCKMVATPIALWNNSWLPATIPSKLPVATILNIPQLVASDQIITICGRPPYV